MNPLLPLAAMGVGVFLLMGNQPSSAPAPLAPETPAAGPAPKGVSHDSLTSDGWSFISSTNRGSIVFHVYSKMGTYDLVKMVFVTNTDGLLSSLVSSTAAGPKTVLGFVAKDAPPALVAMGKEILGLA